MISFLLKYKWILILLMSLFCLLPVRGQQFRVGAFRMLSNDISAYVNPVRDLNQEACALIKVVGEPDFVFSTPLGIVLRKEEVGEIWLYVPHGTIKLTIKHPRWGVLRDYSFSSSLESRMTYELVLVPPLEQQSIFQSPLVRKKNSVNLKNRAEVEKTAGFSLPVTPWVSSACRQLLLVNLSLGKNGSSYGLRWGMVKRHGFYVSFDMNTFSMPETVGLCDETGRVDGVGEIPFYSGRIKDGKWKVMAGGIHRLIGRWCLYEGMGYGESVVAWETSQGTCLHNRSYSAKGLAAELGFLYHFRRMAFSTGVAMVNAKCWEATIGVGLFFK